MRYAERCLRLPLLLNIDAQGDAFGDGATGCGNQDIRVSGLMGICTCVATSVATTADEYDCGYGEES